VDTSVPNVARMYDYYLGGKDNFEADRVAAEEIMRLVPVTRAEAMTNRQFLRLAVRYLATDAGISQFLDIGVGLPTRGAVHEVAREVSEDARARGRLLDGFELIEPEILARYAQPHELGGAASESPVGWRVLARKP
jgi:S-adenosyl methyltransferase